MKAPTSDSEEFVCIDSPAVRPTRLSTSEAEPAETLSASGAVPASLSLLSPLDGREKQLIIRRPACQQRSSTDTRNRRHLKLGILASSLSILLCSVLIYYVRSLDYSRVPMVQLLSWEFPDNLNAKKSFTETDENALFRGFQKSDSQDTKLLPGPQKIVRMLAPHVKLRTEMLPGGKRRLLLEAEAKWPVPAHSPGDKIDGKPGKGFYVLCDGEELLCKCFKAIIAQNGKPPKLVRNCVCEPLGPGDASFEMSKPKPACKANIITPPPSKLSSFVVAFNRYIRLSYIQWCKARRLAKDFAKSFKASTKTTFASVRQAFEKLEPKSTISKAWKAQRGSWKNLSKTAGKRMSKYQKGLRKSFIFMGEKMNNTKNRLRNKLFSS